MPSSIQKVNAKLNYNEIAVFDDQKVVQEVLLMGAWEAGSFPLLITVEIGTDSVGDSLATSKKWQMYKPSNPAIPPLGIYPTDTLMWRDLFQSYPFLHYL